MKVSSWDQAILDRYPFAENVPAHGLTDSSGRPFLSRIDGSRIARYVLITVRDPLCDYDDDPADIIARQLQNAEVVGRSGMFTTITGEYDGVEVSIVSGGSGGPEAELVLMDLFEHSNADTFIRVGGSGGMSPKVSPGDIVISTGIVRDEGLTQAYVPATFPAICDRDVVQALEAAAISNDASYHLGVTRSTDSDFVQSGRPAAGGFLPIQHFDTLALWARSGVLNGDRESAAVVVLSMLYGKRGASICSVADNVVTGEKFDAGAGHTAAIDIALDAVVNLAAQDQSN